MIKALKNQVLYKLSCLGVTQLYIESEFCARHAFESKIEKENLQTIFEVLQLEMCYSE